MAAKPTRTSARESTRQEATQVKPQPPDPFLVMQQALQAGDRAAFRQALDGLVRDHGPELAGFETLNASANGQLKLDVYQLLMLQRDAISAEALRRKYDFQAHEDPAYVHMTAGDRNRYRKLWYERLGEGETLARAERDLVEQLKGIRFDPDDLLSQPISVPSEAKEAVATLIRESHWAQTRVLPRVAVVDWLERHQGLRVPREWLTDWRPELTKTLKYQREASRSLIQRWNRRIAAIGRSLERERDRGGWSR